MISAKKFLTVSIYLFWVLSALGHAASAHDFDGDQGISKEKLAESLSKNTPLTLEQIDTLIQTLQLQYRVKPDKKIPIEGYLYSSGMNGAFLVDHDTWVFDASLKVPGTDEIVNIKELFLCDFHNGGLKAEVAYKWMFTFIPKGVSVYELNGGIYGRGLGGVMEAFVGLEGSWMPAQNRSHDLFHVAIKAGFGAGIIFPKMEFRLREIKTP